MSTTVVIGIDLGGTDIKGGLVAHDGRVLERRIVATEAFGGPDHVVGRIIALAQSLRESAASRGIEVAGVGIGAPGSISSREGMIVSPPNLPRWDRVPVVEPVRSAISLPISLENDANAAVLGEFWRGAGRDCDDVAMLTLGTGIGGGVMLGGQLWRGRFENAAEFGHMIVEMNGVACKCGQRGCLEAYASATATAARATDRVWRGEASSLKTLLDRAGALTARDVVEAASAGDSLAAQVWDETCGYLAVACVNLQHVLNLERIILAGGMSAAGVPLLDGVRRHFDRLMWPDVGDRPQLVLAELGNDAGFIGCAYLALQAAGGERVGVA
ncbi:MAG: ROK family protein [Phycisphaerae bacterium]|nr:ROK family protein [Phycisphaerae bacterium]